MRNIMRVTESDLVRLVKRVVNEQGMGVNTPTKPNIFAKSQGSKNTEEKNELMTMIRREFEMSKREDITAAQLCQKIQNVCSQAMSRFK